MAASNSTRSMLVTLLIFAMVFSPILPCQAVRFTPVHALHRSGTYKHLMNEEGVENLKWLQVFNKYDLYSKSKVQIDVEKVKPYYLSLIEKYFPVKLNW
ncbi:hypothetical protein LWI29_024881 [Acer saccharum]|uniref:Inositol oxygenase n=1 Tax=Acer saccharum TaxID=4024 RepID=A0AA39SQZ7_ACESA|nr:hypothetical protein LWI29_024881 [Acer saccharum]